MGSRLDLHKLFVSIIDKKEDDGDTHVYYNAPSEPGMKYPAIRYNLHLINKSHANNTVFLQQRAYDLTLIDENPDSEYFDKILQLPYCRFENRYVADNLNHWKFTIFY